MSYFSEKEFKCPCCGRVKVSGWLIHQLNKVREWYGKPIIVNSGYRCKTNNKAVGGKSTSAHLKGLAADLKCNNSSDRYLLLYLLFQVGFKRIGVYKNWIHADVDEDLPQKVLWGE